MTSLRVLELIDASLLNPWVSIWILAGLELPTQCKLSVYADANSLLEHQLGTIPNFQSKALKLVGAGVLLLVNRVLSSQAMINRMQAKFDWNKETILLTGVAGSIGAEATRKLADRGSKVVVLDVLPLTYPARK